MVENQKVICDACGATVPEGARFCPQCGHNLVSSDNPPMASAIPVVIDEDPGIAGPDYTSTVTTDAAIVGEVPATSGAMYFKNPSPEILQASDTRALGGVLFIGTSNQRGKFTFPKTIHVGQVLNGQKIDCSVADFVHPVSTINVGNVLGSLKLIVPRGVRVEAKGLGILGSFKGLSYGDATVHAGEDVPTIIIQGLTILGGVNVKVNMDVAPLRVIP